MNRRSRNKRQALCMGRVQAEIRRSCEFRSMAEGLRGSSVEFGLKLAPPWIGRWGLATLYQGIQRDPSTLCTAYGSRQGKRLPGIINTRTEYRLHPFHLYVLGLIENQQGDHTCLAAAADSQDGTADADCHCQK